MLDSNGSFDNPFFLDKKIASGMVRNTVKIPLDLPMRNMSVLLF